MCPCRSLSSWALCQRGRGPEWKGKGGVGKVSLRFRSVLPIKFVFLLVGESTCSPSEDTKHANGEYLMAGYP